VAYPQSTRRAGPETDQPLYQQLLGILKREIATGVFPVGAQIPTEERLCRRFHVSRHTVREALRQLRADGLILSRRGAGTVVAKPGVSGGYAHTVASIEELISYAQETRYEIETSGVVIADAALAKRLGCPRGQSWLRISGLRYAPGQTAPLCSTEVYVHKEFSGITRLVARRSGPIYAWIEDLYGERIAEIEQVIQARTIPRSVAGPLLSEPGAAGIEIRRTYRLSSGVIAEIAFNLHRADRFRYVMTLKRNSSGALNT